MNALKRASVTAGGGALVVLGLLHVVMGLPVLQRAVQRGDLAQRLAAPQMVNWAFSGAAMCVFGVLALLAGRELNNGGRLASRLIGITGVFFTALGLAAYAFQPTPAVLVFAVVGLMLWVPVARSAK
jgi:hypothetical protein